MALLISSKSQNVPSPLPNSPYCLSHQNPSNLRWYTRLNQSLFLTRNGSKWQWLLIKTTKKCLLLVNLIHGWQPILTTMKVFVYLGLIPFLLILYLCSSLLLLSFLSLASASWTVPIALPHSSKINHFLLGPTPFRWFHVTQRNPMGWTLHYPVTRSLQNVRIHL